MTDAFNLIESFFEDDLPTLIIKNAVKNMSRDHWGIDINKLGFGFWASDDKQEFEFFLLGQGAPFRTTAFVQNKLTDEIYDLIIERENVPNTPYSTLHIRRVESNVFEEEIKKGSQTETSVRIEGGEPFTITPEYLRKQKLIRSNHQEPGE